MWFCTSKREDLTSFHTYFMKYSKGYNIFLKQLPPFFLQYRVSGHDNSLSPFKFWFCKSKWRYWASYRTSFIKYSTGYFFFKQLTPLCLCSKANIFTWWQILSSKTVVLYIKTKWLIQFSFFLHELFYGGKYFFQTMPLFIFLQYRVSGYADRISLSKNCDCVH